MSASDAATAQAAKPPAPGAGRRWRVTILGIVVLGLLVSAISGVLWRASVERSERQSFATAATDVVGTAELLLSRESQFLAALRAGLSERPGMSPGDFDRWFDELGGPKLQFGGLGTLVVRSVSAQRLAAFQRRRDRDPAFRRLVDGRVLPVAGDGAGRSCLLAAGATSVPYTGETATLVQSDWCDPRSQMGGYPVAGTIQARLMREIAESDAFRVYAVVAQSVSTCFIEGAFYRPGAPLATAAERRAALLGWVSTSFSVPALARNALEPHDGLSLTLYHRNADGPLEAIGGAGDAGPRPRFSSAATIQLAGAWTLRVAGAGPAPAMSANLQGLLVAAGGALLTAMLAVLVLTLGRSRERALWLVDEKTAELRHQALHDALTGLPNRVLAMDRAEHMLARARRERLPVAALYVDVDGFKHVNDTFGHAAGDELLRLVAQRLRSVVREGDTAARLGGDEFVVLVEGATLAAWPELVAERLLEVLRQPYDLNGHAGRELTLTASVGVAWGMRDSADALLRDADLALYQAKAAGRNRFVAFRSAMQTAARDRVELELDLVCALERGELFLMYQPIFDLRSERIVGVEALIRWQHPERGVIAPDRFIPIAEDGGLIVAIGAWVLREACRQTAAWHAGGHPLGVAVNVSARQLDSDVLLDHVSDALNASGLEPERLTLEVTETALMRDPEETAARLRALKRLGVRIAIDDFGTGYSSLAYLRQFPADTLKIDRSFVGGMAGSPQSTAIIHTLVQLGKALRIETLAEGIEDRSQLAALQREHCDHGQGFLFSRPLQAHDIDSFLDAPVQATV